MLVLGRLEISMFLMEVFVLSFKWNLFFDFPVEHENGTTEVFLECLLTLSNVDEKVKIFEIIESSKPRANTDDPFGVK